MRCVALLLALVSTGCAKLELRGGTSLSDRAAQGLSVRAVYRPLRCEDAGGAVVRPAVDEELAIVPSGVEDELLIRKEGRQAWLVGRAFEEGGEQVYQLSLEGPSGLWLLRDVRLGADGGRMAFVSRWTEQRKDGRIRAHFEQAVMTCELGRVRTWAGAVDTEQPLG